MDGLYPIIRAEQMHRSIIVQLFGLMCQNCPENGSNLFGQIHSELHSQTFRTRCRERSDSGGLHVLPELVPAACASLLLSMTCCG